MFSAELKCQLDAFLSTNESPRSMTVGGGEEICSHLELAGKCDGRSGGGLVES